MKKVIAFIVRFKLYHLPFWFVYHYLWWALMSGSIVVAAESILFSSYKVKFASYVVFQALGVYFNLYFLIPRLLQQGKYVIYGFSLASTILATAALITSGYYVNTLVTGLSLQELFNVAPGDYWTLFKTNAFPSTAASMTLAMSIKLTKHWIKSEQKRNVIEKEKLQAELKFLRAQLNPHFLFNTINSIFVLIHKNQDMASDSLAKFSELLRYQLYHSNEPFITLDKEVEYLNNFIELEKLRHDTDQLQLFMQIDQTASHAWRIAPFLLIPFVENAFKHVSRYSDQSNWIRISLHLKGNKLVFGVSNSVQPLKVVRDNETSGVGLTNVKRRLELLYTQAYSLDIRKDDRSYTVELQIELNSEENRQPKIA